MRGRIELDGLTGGRTKLNAWRTQAHLEAVQRTVVVLCDIGEAEPPELSPGDADAADVLETDGVAGTWGADLANVLAKERNSGMSPTGTV